jgi:hypothetical protein
LPALLVLTPPPAPVPPGGEAIVTARIRNTGTVVDQFTLQVLGAAAAWSMVEPPETSLFPGADGEARIHLKLPTGSSAPAGPLPVGVMIRSAADGGTTVEETVITVLPAVVVISRLVPRRSKGSSGGRHRVMLRNTGNVGTTITLNASDPDEVLSMRVSPKTVTIPPGGKAEARVRLRPKSRTWTGGAEAKDFTVSVVPQGAEPQAVPGTFVQQPTVRGWMLMGLVAAVVVIGVILVLSHANNTPSTAAKNAGANAGLAGATTSTSGTATDTGTASATTGTPAPSPTPGGAAGGGTATSTQSTGSGSQRLQSQPPAGGGGSQPTSAPPPPPTPTAWPSPPASLFAVVKADGSLGVHSAAVTGSSGSNPYQVTFDRDVSQCSWTAVPQDTGTVEASVSSDSANTPSVVRVEIKKPYGLSSGGFTLNVVCDTSVSQWVVVGYHADKRRGTATQVQLTGTGAYRVNFPTTVSGCAYVATNGDPGGQPYVYAPAVVLAYQGSTPTEVVVEFHEPTSGAAVDSPPNAPASAPDPTAHYPFHLQVFCNPNAYWTRVTPPSGSSGTHGSVIGARNSAGKFDLVFDRDLTSCAWMATVGPGGGAGHIATSAGPGGPRVFITNDTNTGIDLPFSFVALC